MRQNLHKKIPWIVKNHVPYAPENPLTIVICRSPYDTCDLIEFSVCRASQSDTPPFSEILARSYVWYAAGASQSNWLLSPSGASASSLPDGRVIAI